MGQKSPPRPPSLHDIPRPHPNPNLSVLFLTFGVVGAAVLLVAYLIYIRKFYANLNNSPRRIQVADQPAAPEEDGEEFVDENQSPVLDHPIWYIRTAGLQQSIIESIAVFKYKRAEGLIEGTECSVCLNEFQEDETLRLLPKCSHAFHIPCIDTWLRSHKNCPLCRAPIVCDLNVTARANAQAEPNLNDAAGSREVTQAENLENHGEAGEDVTNEMGESSTEERTTPINEILPKDSNTRNFELRVSSDLAGRHTKVLEEELQPVRRSVSMDDSSASAIYLAVADIPRAEQERRSSTQLVQTKKPNSEKVDKRGNRNSSLYRVMKSCSFGTSLQKGSVSMKRSLSSRRYSSRSRDLILPL